MKLVAKLATLTLAVATVPLAIAGYSLERVSRRALADAVAGDQGALARSLAARIGDDWERSAHDLEHAPSLLPRGVPAPELLEGMLRVVYHQRDDITAVWLFDEQGHDAAPAQFVTDPGTARGLERHEAASAEAVAAARTAVPLARALEAGRAIAVIIATHPSSRPTPVERGPSVGGAGAGAHVILAQKVLIDVPAGPAPHVLAVELTLGELARSLSPGGDASLALEDPAGTLAAGQLATGDILRADAPVTIAGQTPLRVVVTIKAARALGPVTALRARMLYWLAVAILAAVLFAILVSRELSGRVKVLAARCAAIARGAFDERVPVTSNDELGGLAGSLNQMAGDLGTRTRELANLNADLERRVAEKTSELRDAQDQILRSKHLAAMGTMGAGMAHEINNPLTGVLGLTQILQGDFATGDPKRQLLDDIEQQALRIQKIVANLLELSKWSPGEMVAVDLNQVIGAAVAKLDPAVLAASGIAVDRQLTEPLPSIRGNPEHLAKAFDELFANAQRAMPEGGRLAVATASPEGAVVARIEDTGQGIRPDEISKIFDPFFTTKANWSSVGMGLTMVHKIVEEHHGTIAVKSQHGEGATFTLTFPVAPARPLLP